MVQQTGETRDAIIEEDQKQIEAILAENKGRNEPYWIVIFAKPSRSCVEGKPTLVKHIKAYGVKPTPQVGMITGKVDNDKGTVEWDINMPQRPFDMNALVNMGAKQCDEVITETTSIAGAYLTK